MPVNKSEVQILVNFLEKWRGPIDVSSRYECAACLIGQHCYDLESSCDIYSESIREISERTGIDSSKLHEIFCNEFTANGYSESNWLYEVTHSRDVTKEMIIEQLEKFLH